MGSRCTWLYFFFFGFFPSFSDLTSQEIPPKWRAVHVILFLNKNSLSFLSFFVTKQANLPIFRLVRAKCTCLIRCHSGLLVRRGTRVQSYTCSQPFGLCSFLKKKKTLTRNKLSWPQNISQIYTGFSYTFFRDFPNGSKSSSLTLSWSFCQTFFLIRRTLLFLVFFGLFSIFCLFSIDQKFSDHPQHELFFGLRTFSSEYSFMHLNLFVC